MNEEHTPGSEKDQDPGTQAHQDEALDAQPQPGPKDTVPQKTDSSFHSGMTFEEMGLSPKLLDAVHGLGFTEVAEVQKATIPPALSGRDLIVQARTGSGKTAAFGIPIAEKLVDPSIAQVQALVLCPTRELAKQVAAEVSALGKAKELVVLPVYGGALIGPQINVLKSGAHVVVGTPGRVLDHLKRSTLKPDHIRLLVLDECDEMLSMGFIEDIQTILSYLPQERQTLLFSATVSEEVERLGRRHMKEAEKISLSEDYIGVKEVQHYYYIVTGVAKHRELLRVLQQEAPHSAIIFCNTRDDTSMVASYLTRHGYEAEPISSDLSQTERERVMQKMKEGRLRFLVATDVAARGIDIQDLSYVLNYDFPDSSEMYVHRTGRTGRAGKAGVAVSLVSPRELGSFYYMKLSFGIEPEERRLPTEQELVSMREGERYGTLIDRFDQDPSQEYVSLARRIWHSARGEQVFGGILEEHFAGRMVSRAKLVFADSGSGAEERSERRESAPERDQKRGEREGRRAGREWDRRDGNRGRERDRPRGESTGRGGGRGDRPDKDRADRSRPRRPRQESGTMDAAADESRLYVNLGRRDELNPQDLKQLLCELTGVAMGDLGRLQLRETHSYLIVRAEHASRIIEGSKGKAYRSKSVIVEPARK